MRVMPHAEVNSKPMKGTANKTVDATCIPCQYFCYNTQTCDYYLMTKAHRGCPAGDGCDKFERRGRPKKFGAAVWYTPSTMELMRKCYDMGLTDRQIAVRLGLSIPRVTSWRQMSNLPAQSEIRKECEPDWI